MDRKKALELDKICRLCISERKEMRPLFSEKVPEMLMDCTSVRIVPTEGWPDKICVQCVHSVSRNHAFKTLVERSDKELREYITGLTVRMAMEEQSAANAKHQQQQERKQQKLLQKQLKQQQNLDDHFQQQMAQQQQQQQQQQHQHIQSKPKLKPLLKKGSRQIKLRHLEAATASPPAQVQLMPEPAPIQPQQPTLQQQLQQIQLPTLQQAPTHNLISTTSAGAMPQQILLPNGQFITTAQIVAPQLAQIISTAPHGAANGNGGPQQAQFLPHLLQAPNGQTLQIVQQPNGTQTLQLVQLVPQRSMAPTGVTTVTTTTSPVNMGNGPGSLQDADVHLLEDGCDVEDEEFEEVYESMDGKGQSFETIVLDEDQHQEFLKDHQHQVLMDDDLTQSEGQEPEYFDELDQQQLEDSDLKTEEDEDRFIIEEIQLEEEDLMEEADETITPDCEYITDEADQHNLSGDMDDELHYAIMEPPDGDASGDLEQAFLEPTDGEGSADMEQAFMDADDVELHQHHQDDMEGMELQSISLENAVVEFSQATTDDNMGTPTLSVSSPSPTPKRAKRGNQSTSTSASGVTLEVCNHQSSPPAISSKLAAANSRQLVQTASVIAAAGADDNYEIDANLVTEFIKQHTSPLGSGRYVCHLCSTEFRQFKGLQNHMHSHTNWIRANCKKQPQCQICLKSFKGPGMLRMHMKTHDAETNTPVCTICNRTFKSKAILYRHRQTHQQRAYCCGVSNCRKNFSSAANLRWHVERKHPDVIDPFYKCGECSTLYDSIDGLQQHVENTDHSEAQISDTTSNSNAAFSGAVSIVSNGTDMSNMIAAAPGGLGTGAPGDTHAVVVGSSGEVYFVTQA
ncbi:transcriptional repressor CTCF [Drosophila madeirensis]|uniref:Transcriptional repressor CTCF n=1 Tax=Drosophila madeirensis TaxID=30013 RepID=A0AAU9GD12_DROMD